MRFMIRFSIPTESGNDLVASGKIGELFGKLMEDLHPEAVYAYPEAGERGGIIIVNGESGQDVAKLIEPLWLGLGASVELIPVMTGEDLMGVLPSLQEAARRYS